MGSYTDVKNLIISNIKANGQREITGPILQDVLLNMLENSSRVEEITYNNLKALRDGAKLTPSRLYRITDYITTTAQSNTKSARHPFDVIVLAISESELLEQAWAIQHEGDEYFANNNLNAWKIWYCIDNDTTRFDWADETNGKGVIYRMIDEFNNDIPYDFKNIQFKHPTNTATYPHYYYTFASNNIEDNTDYSLDIIKKCYSNIIREYITESKRSLNKILFIGDECYSNSFNSNCYNNTFWWNCCYNKFDSDCYDNIFDTYCECNTFGNGFHNNNIRDHFYENTIDKYCYGNEFRSSCTYNKFGTYYHDNYLNNYCSFNSFEPNCAYIQLDKYCRYNHFGNGCFKITLKGDETSSPSNLVQNYNFAQGLNHITVDGVMNRDFETRVEKDSNGNLKEYCLADLISDENDYSYYYSSFFIGEI